MIMKFENPIWERFKLVLMGPVFLLICCTGESDSLAQNLIAVNSAGYRSDDPKRGYTTYQGISVDSFQVVDASSLETVYQDKIRKSRVKAQAFGSVVHELDFSAFDRPGRYRLFVPGANITSVPFEIGSGVYGEAIQTAMQSFYYQRCGTRIDTGTPWRHEACHLEDAVFFSDPQKHIDVTGGWHDAGDYGKFSVNTSVSLAFLLYLYDHHPEKFRDGQLAYPEPGNGIPDLLDEARWALVWLLKMQNGEGGVYHKVQKKKWTGEYLPGDDPDIRYIFEVSSAATADFAAVAALGARLFESFDPAFSDTLTRAARKAWSYIDRHPQIVPQGGFTNPQDVRGGEYGDTADSDERLWAAAELYRLTGDSEFSEYFVNNYRSTGEPGSPPVSWKNVGEFAVYTYLRMPVSKQDREARTYLLQRISGFADRLLKRVMGNGYRVVLNKDEYYWGSNSVVLGYAFNLVQAYELTGLKLYRDAALDQLHYILGCNPFGLTFVTGIGSNPVQHPYHQFSIELNVDQPVPGMVVGGPNSHNLLNGKVLSEHPGKAYEDSHKNYTVNETAINYTAPFVYLAGFFAEMDAVTLTSESRK